MLIFGISCYIILKYKYLDGGNLMSNKKKTILCKVSIFIIMMVIMIILYFMGKTTTNTFSFITFITFVLYLVVDIIFILITKKKK